MAKAKKTTARTEAAAAKALAAEVETMGPTVEEHFAALYPAPKDAWRLPVFRAHLGVAKGKRMTREAFTKAMGQAMGAPITPAPPKATK